MWQSLLADIIVFLVHFSPCGIVMHYASKEFPDSARFKTKLRRKRY